MILLDTDHISVLQRRSTKRDNLISKIDASGELPATSIVTLEEQSRSWIAAIGRRRDIGEQVVPYQRLLDMFAFFAEWEVIPLSIAAADVFAELRSQRVRVATTDLKIASISIANDLMLLTANSRDFDRVPNLRFENWLD